jgi:hypothetical protein
MAILKDNNLAGLAVDSSAFSITRHAINRMEWEQLQFVNSAIRVQEESEGSKEFLVLQRKEIEAAHQELSKTRSELEGCFTEL